LQTALDTDGLENSPTRVLDQGIDACHDPRRGRIVTIAIAPALESSDAERGREAAQAPWRQFFLAVIAGLEEGYETIVRLIADPLRTLELKPTTSVTLTGIAAASSALEVRFPHSAASSTARATDREVG
jgi:hypothetical protein